MAWARCARALRGDAATACPAKGSARAISAAAVSVASGDTARKVDHQEALCLDVPGIESQHAIDKLIASALGLARLQRAHYGRSAENVVKGIGIAGWPGGLSIDQLDAERDRDPPCDVVFQGKQIPDVTVEPVLNLVS